MLANYAAKPGVWYWPPDIHLLKAKLDLQTLYYYIFKSIYYRSYIKDWAIYQFDRADGNLREFGPY